MIFVSDSSSELYYSKVNVKLLDEKQHGIYFRASMLALKETVSAAPQAFAVTIRRSNGLELDSFLNLQAQPPQNDPAYYPSVTV